MNFYEETFSKDQDLGHEMRGREFQDCVFDGCQMESMIFWNCRFIDCQFKNCNMSLMRFPNTLMRGCHFENCRLDGINWTELWGLHFPVFKECVLDYSVFCGVSLKNSSFERSRLVDVDFAECDLAGSTFYSAILKKTNFIDTNLRDCDLRGATEYVIDPTFTNIKNAKFSLPEAVSLLQSFDIELD